MDTKLESRQGQFPATFPDTFKNFFAIMHEDEDHTELFSNLLEDKVIPRRNKFQQRRCGGSLRCSTSNPHSRRQLGGGMVHNVVGSSSLIGLQATSTAKQNNVVGRSNSFRFIRPCHHTFSTSSLVLNNVDINASGVESAVHDDGKTFTETDVGGGNSFCKHMKYCCLHQQQPIYNKQNQQQSQSQKEIHATTQKICSNQLLFQQQPVTLATLQQQQQQQQQQQSQQNLMHFCPESFHYDYSSSSTRPGPDGEDNNTAGINNSNGQLFHQHHQLQQKHHPSHQHSNYVANTRQETTKQPQQKRHSIILERAFDFDVSCDENDSISSTSSTQPVATVTKIPYNVLKPILKQPQQNLHQQNQLQQQRQHIVPKSILKDSMQYQRQQKLPRTLPHPPKNAGLGAFHNKESALQRIQQQSGLLLLTNKTNITTTTVTTTTINALNTATVTTTNCIQNPLSSNNYYQTCNNDSNSGSSGNGRDVGGGGGGGDVSVSSNNNITTNIGKVRHTSALDLNTAEENMAAGSAYPNSDNVTPSDSGMTALSNSNNSNSIYIDNSKLIGTDVSTKEVSRNQVDVIVHEPNNSYRDLQSPGAGTNTTSTNIDTMYKLNGNNLNSMNVKQQQKSPIFNRRRSSSIGIQPLRGELNYRHDHTFVRAITASSLTMGPANVITHTHTYHDLNKALKKHNQTRERVNLANANNNNNNNNSNTSSHLNMMSSNNSTVLTFQQAISGAVSPQYSTAYSCGDTTANNSSNMVNSTSSEASKSMRTTATVGNVMTTDSDIWLKDIMTSSKMTTETITLPLAGASLIPDTPTNNNGLPEINSSTDADYIESPLHERSAGVGSSCQPYGSLNKGRMRTSSMPGESRKPRLADTRRAAIHCADLDLEYYRLRSFSITSHGVCNLGDSLRSRRSRSITSVTSTVTSNSGKDRHNSNASRTSGEMLFVTSEKGGNCGSKAQIPVYKIAMLGASGVGKTTLTYQFTTSDYICAYDLSLDDDYGQKTVSVLVDGIETDLEIIDHPACEMSTEAFCSTYNIDLFVVVYSVVDRSSFKDAEKILQYLKDNEMLLTRGAILVGNKTDLERHREVNRQMARKLATDVTCKFIETSSGLDHNVDELLVGIVAQVKLNPQRIRNLSEKVRQRLNLQNTIQKRRHMYKSPTRIVRQMSMCQPDNELEAENNENVTNNTITNALNTDENNECIVTDKPASVRKMTKRPLNLESILKMGESELEDEEDVQSPTTSKFELLRAGFKSNSNCRNPPITKITPLHKSRRSINRTNTNRRVVDGADFQEICDDIICQQQQQQPRRHSPDRINNITNNDCNGKTISKLTSRTKTFISSVLRFKKAINVTKRRNSSSCSDLFVI